MHSNTEDGEWRNQIDKEEQHFYNIITGKYKYAAVPWRAEDLEPDLILTLKLPEKASVEKQKFLSVSNYIACPQYDFSNAFIRAEKNILADMTKRGQNQADTTLKIRLQKAIKECGVKIRHERFLDDQDEEHEMEIECIHEKGQILDAFTIQYNAIVYTLQRVCGFRVRSFLLYNEEGKDKRIFLFLNLSLENRLRIAGKYKIKKEIDYSLIDFYLNDPCGLDGRPLRVHSGQTYNTTLRTFYRQINRYFGITDAHLASTDIIDEIPFTYDQQDRFLLQTEDLQSLLHYYKLMKEPILSRYEKQYIFKYNNSKINRGCKILYHKHQQRKQFFQLSKYLSEYYGFESFQEPEMYEQFIIPGKEHKGSGYFQRMKAISLYKPQIVGPNGELDLFLKMEKIKLAYVLLKTTFKINFLEKIGFDMVALGSNFELTGKQGNNDIKGGVDGENVTESWPVHSFLTQTNVVRNYFGNLVGHEISLKIKLIYFFTVLLVPYLIIYILEELLKSRVYLYTDFVKLFLMAIAFQVFLTIWRKFQQEYVEQFTDDVSSKEFLSSYRGPYIRNLTTDEVNQYGEENRFLKLIKNIISFIIIGALLTIVGLIFFGCQMFLIAIYPNLAKLKLSFFSLPHLIAYFLFFLFVDLFRYFATDRILSMLTVLHNPASDQQSRSTVHQLKFYYLLGIQLIAPFFFLILEPLLKTSCYSKNCINEIIFYIYARYQIKLAEVLIKLGNLIYSKSKTQLLTLFKEKEQSLSFQGKIRKLLMDSLEQTEKKTHQNSNTFDIISLIGYSIYSIMLPLVVCISLFSTMIDTFNVRSYLLTQERRPINRSQSILTLSQHLTIIYFVGILVNSWILVFSFNIFERYIPGLISNMIPGVTESSLFMFKLFWTFIIALVLTLLGVLAGEIAKVVLDNWLHDRKQFKFKEHLFRGYSEKVNLKEPIIPTPLRTIFRTYNPQNLPVQLLAKMLKTKFTMFSSQNQFWDEEADTFTALQRQKNK